jgi:acetyl-CoA carboxylase carboxyltransferase component
MNSKHIGADMNYAWPTAEIAVGELRSLGDYL